MRKRFLDRKNIIDMRHVLTIEEQGELMWYERRCYEMSRRQLELQMRDSATVKGPGADLFIRQQKDKRWCRPEFRFKHQALSRIPQRVPPCSLGWPQAEKHREPQLLLIRGDS